MSKPASILKIGGLSLGGLTAIGLIVNAYLVWTSGAKLEKRLTEIEDAGDPVRLIDLKADPVPPEENGAALLRRINDDLKAIEKEFAEIYNSDNLTERQLKTVRATLDAYPNVLNTIEKAVAASHYDPQYDYSASAHEWLAHSLESNPIKRSAARLLNTASTERLAAGQRHDAMRWAIAILRLSSHYEREPAIISHLVSIAIRGVGIDAANRVLRTGKVSDEMQATLDELLTELDTSDDYVHALKTERAVGISMCEEVLPWRQFWLMRAKYNFEVLNLLDIMQEALDNVGKPYDEMTKLQPDKAHTVAGLIVPAIDAGRDAQLRVRAQVRCLRVLLAMQKAGRLEEEDIDLKTLGLPEEAVTDPFTDKPLLVKQTPAGPIIYSVFMNLQDDGGNIDHVHDSGVGPVEPEKPEAEKPRE